MNIQDEINAQIAEITRAIQVKMGPKYRVEYTFKPNEILLYAYGPGAWSTVALGKGAKTIDTAFDNARKVIAALRTIEDENADLGIVPAAHKAPAWMTGEDDGALTERRDRARAAADMVP